MLCKMFVRLFDDFMSLFDVVCNVFLDVCFWQLVVKVFVRFASGACKLIYDVFASLLIVSVMLLMFCNGFVRVLMFCDVFNVFPSSSASFSWPSFSYCGDEIRGIRSLLTPRTSGTFIPESERVEALMRSL